MVFHIKFLGSKVLVYFNLKVNKMFLKMPDVFFFQDDCVQKKWFRNKDTGVQPIERLKDSDYISGQTTVYRNIGVCVRGGRVI